MSSKCAPNIDTTLVATSSLIVSLSDGYSEISKAPCTASEIDSKPQTLIFTGTPSVTSPLVNGDRKTVSSVIGFEMSTARLVPSMEKVLLDAACEQEESAHNL